MFSRKGVNRDCQKWQTGVYLLKGQVAELKFTDRARDVLERVQSIYEYEFLQPLQHQNKG